VGRTRYIENQKKQTLYLEKGDVYIDCV